MRCRRASRRPTSPRATSPGTRAPARSPCRSPTAASPPPGAAGPLPPDVLEGAARRTWAAWAEAVDGDDAALEAVASPEAVGELLYGGDATRKRRVGVRGAPVERVGSESVQ